MSKYLILTLSLLLMAANAHAQTQSKTLIYKVIDNFQTAIIKKDSALFQSLFFDKTTPIIGVMSEATEMSIKKNNPLFEGLSASNSQRFIREICTSQKDQSEKFAKIKIRTGAKLASAQFHYAFYSDGQAVQWGQETWSLVFAEKQWFISSIHYTINFPEVKQMPENLKVRNR